MEFKEFTIYTTDECEELVSDIFWRYTDYGVAVSSLNDVIELTEKRSSTYDYIDDGLFKQKKGVSLVKAYFDLDSAAIKKAMIINDLEALKHNAPKELNVGTLELTERTVDGDEWIDVWRRHYKPINFGKITVCPAWVDFKADDYTVFIGSNCAFGTGEHETTAMCIRLLEKYVTPHSTVVDVGTGSGILGISAIRLGAEKVVMIDNDVVAVTAAKQNVALNHVTSFAEVLTADEAETVAIKGSIVVANITADVLLSVSDQIFNYVTSGGILILSGILNDRLGEVIKHYEMLNFTFVESISDGEWSALVMRLS